MQQCLVVSPTLSLNVRQGANITDCHTHKCLKYAIIYLLHCNYQNPATPIIALDYVSYSVQDIYLLMSEIAFLA